MHHCTRCMEMKEQNLLYPLADLILLYLAPVAPVQLFLWQMYRRRGGQFQGTRSRLLSQSPRKRLLLYSIIWQTLSPLGPSLGKSILQVTTTSLAGRENHPELMDIGWNFLGYVTRCSGIFQELIDLVFSQNNDYFLEVYSMYTSSEAGNSEERLI